jgi:hypothetical protein
MSILYAVVARGSTVLAEHGAASTNASSVARQVLDRLPDGGADSHVSYTQDRYVFHAKRTDGITALCMADDAAGSKPPHPTARPPPFSFTLPASPLWFVALLCFLPRPCLYLPFTVLVKLMRSEGWEF